MKGQEVLPLCCAALLVAVKAAGVYLFFRLEECCRYRGEANCGKGCRVILLDPRGHLFADQAAEIEVFA
jgi:hypothetical protein